MEARLTHHRCVLGPRPCSVSAWKRERLLGFLQEARLRELVQAHPEAALLDPQRGHEADGGASKAFEEGSDRRYKAGFRQALEGTHQI